MKRIYLLSVLFTVVLYNLQAQNKLDIDFKTGDDNLEKKEFQENPEVRIIVKDKPEIVKTNINYRGVTWPNNSIRRVTIPLPNDVTVDELMEIQIYRRPIYRRGKVWDYLVKDNWTLKGLTVLATFKVNEENKQYELLKLTPRGNVFRFIYEKGDSVREGTFFKAPLAVNTDQVLNPEPPTNAVLTAIIGTGRDNLEGGNNNNVDMVLHLRNSPATITINNLNNRRKWNGFSENSVMREIPNSERLRLLDIVRVELKHTGGGGISADNWDLKRIKLTISLGGDTLLLLNSRDQNLLHRFTGEERVKSFDVVGISGQDALRNATISAIFGTGNDNLEGGISNNVSIVLHLRNPTRRITLSNLNKSRKWDNYSVHTIDNMVLERTPQIDIHTINKVEVKHSGGGGLGADNWNLERFKLTITHRGETKVLVDESKVPIHRFTGDARTKEFILE